MKKIAAVCLTLALAAAVSAAASTTAFADGVILSYMIGNEDTGIGPGFTGWTQNADGAWQYMRSGKTVTSDWIEDEGHYYYVNSDGLLCTGWVTVDGSDYYLSTEDTAAHPLGACYISERTPDGSMVDNDGAKITEDNRRNPYGYSCVEVDLTTQTVYAYNGEQLLVATPCVTGNSSNHATPPGHFALYGKETDRTLRGTNDNGTKYASHVDYWMPFNGGIGLHDASWRNTFGGTIYQGGGSHGCVNLPHDAAAAIYSFAYKGLPVIVHN